MFYVEVDGELVNCQTDVKIIWADPAAHDEAATKGERNAPDPTNDDAAPVSGIHLEATYKGKIVLDVVKDGEVKRSVYKTVEELSDQATHVTS